MNKLFDMPFEDLEAIFDNIRAGIVIADSRGVVLWANQYYQEITGIEIKSYIGKTVNDIQRDRNILYMDSTETLFDIVMREKRSVHNVLRYRTTDYIITNTGPILDENGAVKYVLYTLTNFNETIRTQQELSATYARITALETQLQESHVQNFLDKNIIVQDKEMKRLYLMASKVAPLPISVMLLGETGVGKDVMAKYIHKHSDRKDGMFVHVNLGAIPKPLFESELFGYEPGAFTGASKHGKEGLIHLADKGTLFLDEVGEMPLDIQTKLLQVVQEKEVRSLGGTDAKPVDIRIISATNRNLEEMVARGQFRLDLYYRLNVVELHIPPLRDRKADIPLLTAHFLKQFNESYHTEKILLPGVINTFYLYPWPGNVRELCHIIESLVATTEGTIISPAMLPPYISGKVPRAQNSYSNIQEGTSLKAAVAAVEIHMIEQALKTQPTIAAAAAALKLDASTLAKKRKKYGL